MIRSLWYIIKIICVVGLAIYLLVQPGQVTIGWNDYQVTVQLGYAAVALLILVVFVSILSEILTRLSLLPKNLARARAERRRTKGYRALMQSLSAAATGDQKNAYYLAHRAQKFLPESESGLPLLLQAQAISKKGDGSGNEEPYKLLLKNADTALLGIQGLTQNAILAGDFGKALLLARKAFAENPKSQNLAKAVYDLEIKNKLWNDALVTLDKNKKIMRDIADIDRKVIFIVLGDMAREQGRGDEAMAFYKKAVNEDSLFIPAQTRYISALLAEGFRKKALSVLEKAWKKEAHPDYIQLWAQLVPEQKQGKPNVKFRWFQSIADVHPDAAVGQLALARVAIDEQLWGEAKIALVKAEKLGAKTEVYRLWVTLEEKTTNKPDVIRQWLDRAYHTKSASGWVCMKTGRRFAEWRAVVEPENLFNTLIWSNDIADKEEGVISGVLTALA